MTGVLTCALPICGKAAPAAKGAGKAAKGGASDTLGDATGAVTKGGLPTGPLGGLPIG